MNLGERMKRIRLKKGITLLEIANKLNKTEATIQRYESGNIKNLKSDTIEMLANSLGVEPAYLMGWIPEDEEIMTSSKYIHLPTAISAGLPFEVDGVTDYETMTIPDELMGKYAGHKDIIISKINGDSMDKLMHDGSFIAIKPLSSVDSLNNGDIVVFSHNHEYSVKYFYKHDDMLIFKPYSNNPVHYDQSFNVNDGVVIHGKVVTYIVNLD